MEILNIAGLLLIAATNAWIALQIKAQKTTNNIEVLPAELEYISPAISVNPEIVIDYDKLAEALSRQPAPIITVQPAVVPNPTPSYPSGPWWQGPVSETVSVTTDDAEYFTINDGREVPIRTFPKRTVNGRGESS